MKSRCLGMVILMKSKLSNPLCCCCCSAAHSCLTLCNPMDYSMPGFPVHHQLPELAQLMSIESVMPSNHLILSPLLLLPTVFPHIKVFSSESALHIMWSKVEASASGSVLPVNIQGCFPLGLTGLISLQSKWLSRIFSSTTVWKHQFFGPQPALWSNSHIHTWLLVKP